MKVTPLMRHIAIFLALTTLFATQTRGEFSNESELGVVVTGGNTEMEVYNGKTTNEFAFEKNTIIFGGHYMYGTSFGVENSRNWDINSKYKRRFSEKFGVLAGVIVEADEFAGIKSRINLDIGPSYTFTKTKKLEILTEAGYRYRREENLSNTVLKQSQGRLYGSVKKKPSEDITFGLWVEYLPNFTESEDWQLFFSPSFQYNFNSSLALKWGYTGRYDNLPVPGNQKYDFTYLTSLIAKF